MLLTHHQVMRAREHALNNLQGFYGACIDGSERMLALFANARSDTFNPNSFESYALDSAGFSTAIDRLEAWQEKVKATRLIDRIYEISGDTHKAMIEAAEVQLRIVDLMVFAAIERARKSCPWECEVALNAMRRAVESAEQNLHGIGQAAIQSVESVEQEIHQVSESLMEKNTKPKVENKRAKKTT